MKLKVSLTRSIKGGNCYPEKGSEWSGATWRDSGSLGVGAVNWRGELSAWRWVLLWPHSLQWLCVEKAERARLLMALCHVRGTGLLKEWVREWLWCLAMEFKLGDSPEGPSSERGTQKIGSLRGMFWGTPSLLLVTPDFSYMSTSPLSWRSMGFCHLQLKKFCQLDRKQKGKREGPKW